MKKRYILIFFLFTGIFFHSQNTFSEGSKEIWIGNYSTWLTMCNDTVTHCGWTDFAVYGCDPTSRLYFVTTNPSETVYFGFNLNTNTIPNGSHCVFRIKNIAGAIVYPETSIPGIIMPGYIYNIAQARVGPTQIYGSGGYNALDWHPPAPDTYYMEFQVIDNSSGKVTITEFDMDLLDLTVYDSVALQTKPGRLYSQAWELEESNNYSGTFYIYTPDSIITSVTSNNMDGGIWDTYCNQWGCASTGNFASDRKSLHNQNAYLPQYPLFVNPPDSSAFPPAKLLGQLVLPDPWGETNCANGDIIFHVNVNKTAGTVEIDLSFPSPYTDRILTKNVVSGENLITWNGFDSSGLMVPNNVLVTYKIRYMNGLTNLPLFDIEGNDTGFLIGLVRPTGNSLRVYWDDSNIPLGTMNLTGCVCPPGCHPWSDAGYGFGNNNTLNTWWYVTSDSTNPATIAEKRAPQVLVFNQSLPQNFCGATTGVYFSVTPDMNTDNYHWGFTGSGVTINQVNPADNFITIDIASNATSGNLTVYGTNSGCPADGPTSSIPLTIQAGPVMNLPYSGAICSGNTTNIILTSTPPGATFSWTNPAPGCTSNIASCPAGQNNATQINDLLSVTDNNPGTVIYHITPVISQCTGPVQDYVMTVNPDLPVGITISASVNPICQGSTVTFTGVPVNGSLTPTFQWKVNGFDVGTDSPTYSYMPNNGDIVTCVLTSNVVCATGNPATSNAITMTVNPNLVVSISIVASANPFCMGSPVTYTATPTNGGVTPSYQWQVNGVNVGGNSPNYTYNPLNGDLVTCILTSSVACPLGNPATSNIITMVVNSNLPAGITIVASSNPFCPGSSVSFTATPINGGATPSYQWKVNGVNAGTNSHIFTYNPLNGDSVRCVMTSNLNCVTGNPASSAEIVMSGTLAPTVTFTSCFDTLTTVNAKPIKLKGGIPLGGTYSGPGVNSLTGFFTPATAGTGTKTITYSYTNAVLCTASKSIHIIVQAAPAFTCGNNITDIRDNKIYQTVQIGSQCWMSSNLNFGTILASTQDQRDNCISEKYCYNDNPTNCSNQGGLYQWDELMLYDNTPADQGFCPPVWHIPTENDWNTLFANYVNNGFAGSPLKYSGYSGFNALLSGARHIDKSWDFKGFATFFWSSTAYGGYKAWAHGMNDVDPSVSVYPSLKINAFSVRCVHD